MITLVFEVFDDLGGIFLGQLASFGQVEAETEFGRSENAQQFGGNHREIVLVEQVEIGIEFTIGAVDVALHGRVFPLA